MILTDYFKKAAVGLGLMGIVGCVEPVLARQDYGKFGLQWDPKIALYNINQILKNRCEGGIGYANEQGLYCKVSVCTVSSMVSNQYQCYYERPANINLPWNAINPKFRAPWLSFRENPPTGLLFSHFKQGEDLEQAIRIYKASRK